ncbi:MAG: HEPN domain-containing protein [Deltaproteobacteria bacterium]|nr:HEPN domain-containing protein [Deltaproteobacteria bacterium]
MKREVKALAHYRMNRAGETFEDGLLLLKQGSPNGAIGRFYYAAFHAARALLAVKGLDAPRHTGVIKLFSQHFVKTGAVSPETAKVLSRSFEKRLDSEYEDYVDFTKKDAEQVRDEVRQFIRACEKALADL